VFGGQLVQPAVGSLLGIESEGWWCGLAARCCSSIRSSSSWRWLQLTILVLVLGDVLNDCNQQARQRSSKGNLGLRSRHSFLCQHEVLSVFVKAHFLLF
jgi:hypothetical protein